MGKKFFILFLVWIAISTSQAYAGYVPEVGLVYSGELKLTYVTEAGEGRWLPGYMLYLQGQPIPNLYLMMYLQPEGVLVDQILVNFTQEQWEMELGDTTFQQMQAKFFSHDQNQRGGLLKVHFLDEALTLEVLGAKVQGLNVQETIHGEGKVGPYYLSNPFIIPDSETMRIKGVPLRKDEYELDYQSGQINFVTPLELGEEVEVTYTYQPSGGNNQRIIKGINLNGQWLTGQGQLNWFRIEEEPVTDRDQMLLPMPTSLEGKSVTWILEPCSWVELESQIAQATLSGPEVCTDWAYFHQLTLGDQQRYLTGSYTYQGDEFYSSLEQWDPFGFTADGALAEYNLEGRWQVIPQLYLFSTYHHQQDNGDKDPDLITTYEDQRIFKGVWQSGERSSWHLAFQEKDIGDDLIYLPTGERVWSGALEYQMKEETWGVTSGMQVGELKKKDPYARFLNHRFFRWETQTQRSGEGWKGDLYLFTEYSQMFDSPSEEFQPFKYSLTYNLDYILGQGQKLLLHGEEDLEKGQERHLYQLGYQRRVTNQWQGTVQVQREIQEEKAKDKLILHLLLYQPILVDTRWSISQNSLYGQTRVVGKAGQGRLTWMHNQQRRQGIIGGNIQIHPKVQLETLLTYQAELIDDTYQQEVWLLSVGGQYQFHPRAKFKLSSELPLGDETLHEQALQGKAELIFSL